MKKLKTFVFYLIKNTINIANNKKSLKFLAAFSFLESIIIPIPPDIFLIPITLTKKYKWLYLGIYVTFFSVFGGIVGYLIGYYFWDILGTKIVEFYGGYDHIEYIKNIVILIAGFSPIPYKIFTLGSGLLGYNFIMFLLCSIISRGLRFISLSFLVYKYGNKSLNLLDKHFVKFTFIASIILVMAVILFV